MVNLAPVSVIIPCYCCANFLSYAVDSVLRQSMPPVELILIDDASPDNGETRRCINEIIESMAGRFHTSIRFISLESNLGPAGARNAGWDVAMGEYVAFLDADDAWAKEKVEFQFHWMRSNRKYILSCHEAAMTDADLLVYLPPVASSIIRKNRLLFGNNIVTSSVMLKNNLDYRFPVAMRYAEDYFLWLTIATHGERLAILKVKMVLEIGLRRVSERQSANLYLMHRGVISCYRNLKAAGDINLASFGFAVTFERLKFLFRLIGERLRWL